MKLILVFLGIFMMSISSVCNAQEKAIENMTKEDRDAHLPYYEEGSEVRITVV